MRYFFLSNNALKYPNVHIIAPLLLIKNFLVFMRGGAIIWNFHEFYFFLTLDISKCPRMELKLYFITYYRPLVYFEVFFIYLSIFYELCGPQKKAKKNFLDFLDFWIFFPCFHEGGNIWQFGYTVIFLFKSRSCVFDRKIYRIPEFTQ